MGRTGLMGRGLLRRWGPNHAANPIATRYCNFLFIAHCTQHKSLAMIVFLQAAV